MLCSIHQKKPHLILNNTNYQYIDIPRLYLNGETLQVQKCDCHLGHSIGNKSVELIGSVLQQLYMCVRWGGGRLKKMWTRKDIQARKKLVCSGDKKHI